MGLFRPSKVALVTMAKTEKGKKRSALADVVTREYTINLHKRVHGVGFKRRAPRAVKEIKAFAQKVLSKGVKNVPFRIRVRLERKRNDQEDAKNKLYTHVSLVEVSSFKGLQTRKVDE